MERIIVQLALTSINLFWAVWMHEKKNHKTAIFSGFTAGVCFMGLVDALVEYHFYQR